MKKRLIFLTVLLVFLSAPVFGAGVVGTVYHGTGGFSGVPYETTVGGESVYTVFHGSGPLVYFDPGQRDIDVGRKVDGATAHATGVTFEVIDSKTVVSISSECSGYPRWDLPCHIFAEDLGAELITDGGAEDCNAAGAWQNLGPVVWSGCTNTQVVTGSSSWGIEVDNFYDGWASSLAGTVALEEGTTYKITYKIYGDGTNHLVLRFGTAIYWSYSPLSADVHGYPYPAAWTTETWYYTARRDGDNGYCQFYSGNTTTTGTWFVDDVSVKKVANAWSGLPPHGSAIIEWRPTYVSGDVVAFHGVLSANDAGNNAVYISSTGKVGSYDGTTAVYDNGSGFSANEWITIAVKWGYSVVGVVKYRAGVNKGTGVAWGTEANYDSAYTSGNYLRIGYGSTDPACFGKISVFDYILIDREINLIGVPGK